MNLKLSKVLTPIALFLLAALLGYIVLIPAWTSLSETRDALAIAGEQNHSLNNQLREIDNFLSEYEANKGFTETTNLALPVGPGIESVLADLDALASQSGVGLSDVVILDKALIGKPQQYSVTAQDLTLVAAGSYPAFKNFLLLIETNLRIMDINTVNFQVSEDGQTEYQLALTVYYQN